MNIQRERERERERVKTKENKEGLVFWSAVGFVAGLAVLSWFSSLSFEELFSPEFTSAATSTTVNVNASVATTISCSESTTTTGFGTLTSSAVTTSTPNVSSTMACGNDPLGCVLSINDNGSSTGGGGLYASSSINKLIPSPNSSFNATATLAAGTEGYGIQAATTSAGTGGTFGITVRYLQTGGIYGGLTTTTMTLASTSASSSGREVVVTHGAAIAGTTPGGTYADTITYSCTAN